MFLTSTIAVFIVLSLRGGIGVWSCLFISAAAALVCTAVELCTNNGLDTISCPTAAMVVIIPLIRLFGS